MDRRRWSEPVDERIVAEGMQLARREMLRIEDGSRLLVTVESGVLWLTEEGNPGDILVTPGRWYRIERDARVVGLAIQPAQVTISAPLAAPARWQVEQVAADGTRIRRVRRGKPGARLVRSLTAALLKSYRMGRHAARRIAASAREAQLARLAERLDPHTRKDIGLDVYDSWFARAERTRWLYDLQVPSRESTFL